MSERFMIIGGCGYVGINLIKRLKASGCNVCVFDILPCPNEISQLVKYVYGDILNVSLLNNEMMHFKPHIVIHLASWGMSGSAMLSSRCREININGAQETINACVNANIPRLIYTSTYNVIFGGQEIINGDETFPYFPLEKHTDQYSPSKAIAEQLIIKANGISLSNGKLLFTSVIRPAAIYGINEQRHFPRIIEHMDRGIFLFQIGNATVDWLHIDNLIQAYVLCIQKLQYCENQNTIPAGEVYMISDGTPIHSFEFLKPLCLSRNVPYPSLVIPARIVYHFSHLLEMFYIITKHVGIPIEPFLTRAEVYKVAITHYCSIAKAKDHLGYQPTILTTDGAKSLAEHYIRHYSPKRYFRLVPLVFWVLILGGMFLLTVGAFQVTFATSPIRVDLIVAQLVAAVDRYLLFDSFVFRSAVFLRYLLLWAVAMHVGESRLAYCLAVALGMDSLAVRLWTIQTLFCGWPSLRMLYAHRRWVNSLSQQPNLD